MSDIQNQMTIHCESTISKEMLNSPVRKEVADLNILEQDADFTPQQQRAIIRRVDRRLVVTIGIIYCISLIDRTNLSGASIAGMSKQLELQAPSTILVRKIGPRLYITAITFFWGCVMISTGFVKNWQSLLGLRVILGTLEAGFFPSAVYLLSTWYTRYELGKRNSLFYLLACVGGAFSGVLAAGFMQMSGHAGLLGWSWIFIWEGVLTVLIALVAFWLLVDFPDGTRKNWHFLDERELAWVIARVNADRGDANPPPFNLGQYLRYGLDWKIWAYAMISFNTTCIAYALAYFLPIILVGSMGFTILQSQCLVAPPYVLSGIVMFLWGWLGDRYRVRGPFIVANAILCLIGLPLLGFHKNSAVRYFGVFLVSSGANANASSILSYQANNIRGQWKRAFASATMVGFGGLGGIAGSLVFRSQDSPHYRPGIYACITASLLTLVLVAILTYEYWIQNGKADRGEKELETSDDVYQPGFRYTY